MICSLNFLHILNYWWMFWCIYRLNHYDHREKYKVVIERDMLWELWRLSNKVLSSGVYWDSGEVSRECGMRIDLRGSQWPNLLSRQPSDTGSPVSVHLHVFCVEYDRRYLCDGFRYRMGLQICCGHCKSLEEAELSLSPCSTSPAVSQYGRGLD